MLFRRGHRNQHQALQRAGPWDGGNQQLAGGEDALRGRRCILREKLCQASISSASPCMIQSSGMP